MAEKAELTLNTTRAVISVRAPGAPATDMTVARALELINANHAKAPLTADDIYLVPMQITNQNVDSYSTRMSQRSLRNYVADFNAGRPLMNSHRASRWGGGGELPVGRFFYSEVRGSFLSEKPGETAYETQGGAALDTWTYIQCGLRVTDVNTDDLIRAIEGGTISDVSIGFLMTDGRAICSICGSDMYDWETCSHFPGHTYDNGRCFAWIDNAHAAEGSLVYKGSTPGAMIEKATRMLETGGLSQRDALALGEQWGVRLLGERTFAVEKRADPKNGAAQTTDTDNTAETRGEEEAHHMDWETLLADLRALDKAQGDRIAALPEGERGDALLGVIREQRSTIASLEPRAAMGDAWIADLVEGAAKARTRAEGVEKFDAAKSEKYKRVLLASADPDYIKSEIEAWDRQAGQAFGDGKRPTGGAGVKRADEKPTATQRNYK